MPVHRHAPEVFVASRSPTRVGDFPAATMPLDALIATHTPNEGPLTLGNSTRSRTLAIMMDDLVPQSTARGDERWFRPTAILH